jgi:hypothetical protein
MITFAHWFSGFEKRGCHLEEEFSQEMTKWRFSVYMIAIVFLGFLVYLAMPLKLQTDVAEYSNVLVHWEPTGLVDHFPCSVPTEANNVIFSAFPGFLQGGAHMQLRMKLPAAEVKDLYEKASQEAKQYHDGGSSMTLVNEQEDGLASTSPHTLDSCAPEFPKDYRVFVYHAEPASNSWNHGKSKGVVISLERNEVIYFAEDW